MSDDGRFLNDESGFFRRLGGVLDDDVGNLVVLSVGSRISRRFGLAYRGGRRLGDDDFRLVDLGLDDGDFRRDFVFRRGLDALGNLLIGLIGDDLFLIVGGGLCRRRNVALHRRNDASIGIDLGNTPSRGLNRPNLPNFRRTLFWRLDRRVLDGIHQGTEPRLLRRLFLFDDTFANEFGVGVGKSGKS